jgi:hypothetical protein
MYACASFIMGVPSPHTGAMRRSLSRHRPGLEPSSSIKGSEHQFYLSELCFHCSSVKNTQKAALCQCRHVEFMLHVLRICRNMLAYLAERPNATTTVERIMRVCLGAYCPELEILADKFDAFLLQLCNLIPSGTETLLLVLQGAAFHAAAVPVRKMDTAPKQVGGGLFSSDQQDENKDNSTPDDVTEVPVFDTVNLTLLMTGKDNRDSFNNVLQAMERLSFSDRERAVSVLSLQDPQVTRFFSNAIK